MKRTNATMEHIERRYDLSDRMLAVKMFVHAIDHLYKTYGWQLDAIQACEVLSDGIKNALDGRATGDEWRNVRHAYNNERDGPTPPEERDRRCQRCGAVDNPPFSQCFAHLPSGDFGIPAIQAKQI